MKKPLVLPLLITVLFLMPLPSTAQDFCEGLADYDNDVDGTDASMFKTHFGRSTFQNPCPPNGPAPVEKSGQTTSFFTGDDGNLQKGVAWANPRFTDNSDGTVTDNLTGLIWLKDADCFGTRFLYDVFSDIHDLSSGLCGLSDGSSAGDWRLPQLKELQSLVDYGVFNPALPPDNPFINLRYFQNLYYWSSTLYEPNSTYQGWALFFGDGDSYILNQTTRHYIWPVRGGH
jgi:hypothetical protein